MGVLCLFNIRPLRELDSVRPLVTHFLILSCFVYILLLEEYRLRKWLLSKIANRVQR